jgi:hypothetical protein
MGQTANISASKIRSATKAAADWHWYPEGEFQDKLRMITFEDDQDQDDDGNIMFPPERVFIECGNLARIHFRAPPQGAAKHPRRERDTTITFSRPVAAQSHLVFDPEHESERLYMKIKSSAKDALAKRFWTDNRVQARPISEWAFLAGGRHSKGGYPNISAKPVGVMTAVVYFTLKKDDGPKPCFYIHRMGEMSCHFPILACDAAGQLWVCGGNYTSPTPGITD